MDRVGSSDPPIAGGQWPLIGRVRELESLVAARTNPRCHGAVLIGAAGVGKSRLAREALSTAAADGACVQWVHATRSAATVPLGALTEIVPETARSDDVVALMRRSAEGLRDRADGRSIVLGVDDAQLLDPVSAALVLHLAATATAFVIATVRTNERCPDAIVSLWKDEGAARIELGELTDADVRALIETGLGDPVEYEAAQWVIDVSRGNALYVSELVRGAVASGALRRRDGLWTMERRPRASSSLIELVAARLAELDDVERTTVELLALGEPLSLAELSGLGSLDAVLHAEALGLLTAAADGVRLAHPLYGEALRASLPTLRGQMLRLRLVSVLERRRPFGPDEALRVARLRLDAGAALPEELTLEAARAANRAGDPQLGGQLAELALADGGGLAVALVLAQAQRLQGLPAEAEATYAAVEALAPGDPAARLYARERLGVLYWELRRTEEAMALLDRMAKWSDERGWQMFMARIRGTYEGVTGGLRNTATIAEMADDESLAEAPRRLGGALHRLGLTIAGDGDAATDGAFAHLPTLPVRDEADVAMLATFAFAAIESGHRLAELEEYLTRLVGDAIRMHVRDMAGVAALGLGRLYLLRGRYRDAARWLTEAEVQLQRGDPFNQLVIVRAAAVLVAAGTRDYDAALAAHARLSAWVAEHEPLAAQRPGIARAEASVEWLRDPGAAGRRLLADAEALAEEMPGLAPALAYDALRAGDPRAAAVVIRLAGRCRAEIVGAFADHASAHDAGDGPALLRVADAMAELGATRYAVEAASEAATVFVADGRSDSARRAAARARELHVEGQGASLPVIDGLDATAVELTPRESQLIGFARQGLSNAEIADRLVISVRTVETHLYRGMQKLGVRNRRDL